MTSGDPVAGLNPLLLESVDWIVRRRSSTFSAADRAELARWRASSPDHDAAYREAWALSVVMSEAGQEILRERATSVVVPLRRPVVSRRMMLTGAAAASVVGALIVGRSLDLLPSVGRRTADFATLTGERRTIDLADGLRLELDAKTSIGVDWSRPNRIELLSGRAEIDAELAESAGVTVVSGGGEVSAQKARFEVRLDDRGSCVTCIKGVVTVARGSKRALLESGQQLLYTETAFGSPVRVDPAEIAAWKNGQLIFHQTPLSEVVREVNRYREGKVVIANPSAGRRPVNGVFYTERIEDAVGQIQQITDTRATRLPSNLIVLS